MPRVPSARPLRQASPLAPCLGLRQTGPRPSTAASSSAAMAASAAMTPRETWCSIAHVSAKKLH